MHQAHAHVAARVRAVIAVELCCPPDLIRPESQLADLPGLDSVKLMRVIAALETEFDLGLDDERLHSIRAVGDIATLVEDELTQLVAPEGQ
jgi:acyl carrier protein